MTVVRFETATISEAIKAANRVAPSKGQAFDKASGIVLEVNPADGTVIVKATNTDIFHMAWVSPVHMEGPATVWRLPSSLLASHLASLPIGSGKEVTFTQADRRLTIKQDKITARFNLIDADHYPVWSAFDPDNLLAVKDFGGKAALVEWAADKSEIPLCGVHFNGSQAIATDRYTLACVPLDIPGLDGEVTVPAGLLGPILKETGEVMVAVDGTQMYLMPDDYTQLRVVIYGEQYVNVKRIMENSRDYPNSMKIRKNGLLEVIGRVTNFQGSERVPTLRLFIGLEEIRCMMKDGEKADIGDVFEVPGQAIHGRAEFRFTPAYLTNLLNQAPNEEVTVHYDPDKPNRLIYIDGGSGFEAWVMPRREIGERSV